MYSYLRKSRIMLYAFCFIELFFLLMESAISYAEVNGLEYKALYPEASQSDSNKEKIRFIQSEIDKISQDLEWLSSRIKEMEMFRQFVPDKMYKSVEFKRKKIEVLSKLKGQLDALAKKDRKIEPVKKNPPPTKKTTRSPDDNRAIKERIKQFGLSDWLELVKDKNGARIENRLPILFASGSAEIAEEYKSFLKTVARLVKGVKIRVLVDGYADSDPIHTTEYSSNFELGAARAASVVHELVKNGVNPDDFKIGTTGSYRSGKHKASKWKALDRHVNLTIFFPS